MLRITWHACCNASVFFGLSRWQLINWLGQVPQSSMQNNLKMTPLTIDSFECIKFFQLREVAKFPWQGKLCHLLSISKPWLALEPLWSAWERGTSLRLTWEHSQVLVSTPKRTFHTQDSYRRSSRTTIHVVISALSTLLGDMFLKIFIFRKEHKPEWYIRTVTFLVNNSKDGDTTWKIVQKCTKQ